MPVKMDKNAFCGCGPCWSRFGYLLRPARDVDAVPYYEQNFCPLDPELARLTGCPERFEREALLAFFRQCVQAENRYDFLLISLEGRIVEVTRDFAFGTLGLHRLEPDVFSTNPRAEQVYRKAGFQREGVRREAIRTADGWADDILMALLASEWSELVKKL